MTEAGEIREGDCRSASGSGPSSHQREMHSLAMEFVSTMGCPGEDPPRVPDFGFVERCSECDLNVWRASRAGKAGTCETCKNVRKRGTEMAKCSVPGEYVRRATIWRREENPPRCLVSSCTLRPKKPEMPDQDSTPLPRPLPRNEAPWPILERLRELANKNISNTITFIPHKMRNTCS